MGLLKEKEAAEYLTDELSKLEHPVSWMEQGGRVYLLTLPEGDSREAEQVLLKSVLKVRPFRFHRNVFLAVAWELKDPLKN